MSRSSKLTYVTGDLFAAPPNSILVHACNASATWGAGIAKAFRGKYPAAFEIYKAHCKASSPDGLVGTCLLIRNEGRDAGAGAQGHDIACLFTSRAYGRKKDAPEDILNATTSAVTHLLLQNQEGKALHACRINSGKFAIPWESTAAVLDGLQVEMVVYDPVDAKPIVYDAGGWPLQCRDVQAYAYCIQNERQWSTWPICTEYLGRMISYL